ncbi:conserved hypothetical protein [uncultured Desulfatiglans sp.]|uniref:Uncharacterized protein n=1 Tax=Uncultured Desulfatiglans sp. TaxID=1748965 RepID=A0A653A963_UNCDX|nr:conserved hypothetical protein [uncultured Desulfatiglans sp.]
MEKQLRLVRSARTEQGAAHRELSPEERQRHFRNVMGSLIQGAQDSWGDIWQEFQGNVVENVVVHPSAREGFTPACGWPEFLEKMWILKHHLDHAKRLTEKGSL